MKKASILLYGLLAYFMFFGAFLYLIGFLLGVVVPKDINSGQQVDLTSSFIVNLGFILVFAIQHTVMARTGFKRWWSKIIPASIERSTFVLVTSLILIAMFYFWKPLPASIWKIESGVGQVLMYLIAAIGWGIVFISTFLINHFDLFGLRQVYFAFRGKEYSPVPLKVISFYRLVRHPLMFGFLLAFWATPDMTLGHLVFALGFTIYILVGVQFEERTLMGEFGSEYENYRASTPSLIPTWRRPLSSP